MSKPEKKKYNPHGTNRRTFLKSSAFTAAAFSAGHLIKQPEISRLSASQESAEGVITEKWIPTSCLNCSTRCAIMVRVVNGKAVKITGNPLSRVSEGQICPRGHIGLQVLYDPNRVREPLKRTNQKKGKGVDPGWTPITWNQALREIITRLKSLKDKAESHKVLLFHGLNSISNQDMIIRFAEAYGTPNVFSGEAHENVSENFGRWMADGNTGPPGYDLGNSNYILAFGANIVESVKPLARNLRMWGKIRRERPNRAKVVVIDPRYSVTAAKADRWIPINPGTDGALAMAIANVIISEKLYDSKFTSKWTSGFEEYKKIVLNSYDPEKITTLTGIEANSIRLLAKEFAQTKPAIAWIGRGASRWPNGSYNSYAIFCLNALVGSIDTPGGIIYQEDPSYNEMSKPAEDAVTNNGKARPKMSLNKTTLHPHSKTITHKLIDSLLNKDPYPIEMAMGFNSNFNMSEPGAGRWNEALSKFPFYVHIAPFISEMAEYADIMLPTTTFLEEWGYDHSPPGSGFAEAKIKQPVVEPLAEARCITAIIFDIANKLEGTTARFFTSIGSDAQSFVRYRTKTIVPWAEYCKRGIWIGPEYQHHKYARIFKTPSKKFEFCSKNLENLLEKQGIEIESGTNRLLPHYEECQFLGAKENFPLILSTYQPLLNIDNGSQNYPWAQEVFMVQHGVGWTNFAEINDKTARALGINDKDQVWIESPFGRLMTRARVIQGIHPQVVSISQGQGHYAGGKWQVDIGVNPNEIIGTDQDHLSGQPALFNTRVKIYKA